MNSSPIRLVLALAVAALLVAARAEAQSCRGTEAMDRDHPYEVGPILEFGQGNSSLGGTVTVGNKSEFFGGAVERVTNGSLFGGNSTASLRLSVDGGVQISKRKGALAICPFAEVAHVGSQDALDPQSTLGALSITGGVTVGFLGAHSDDFRIVPLIGGGVVKSRESRSAPRGGTAVWTTGGIVEVGLGLVREDSTSFIVSYTVAFNSTLATSTIGIALNFAIGQR